MGLGRKAALKRLRGLVIRYEKHISKILESPGHSSLGQYAHEVPNWLQQMEEVFRRVGKRTKAEWRERLKAAWDRLEDDAR